MKSLTQNIHESMSVRDDKMWKLVDEINLPLLMKHFKKDEDLCNAIYVALDTRIAQGKLTPLELEDITSNIRGKATHLADYKGRLWGRGDDSCYDIACAVVGFGKECYEKCLQDDEYCKSMKKETREFENYLYGFNDAID